MKQGMIVLTLWILSQDAYCQSVKLEEYAHGNSICASTERPNTLINRLAMADVDPFSSLTKTEAPATVPVRLKSRPSGTGEVTSQELKALWANTKALEDNTRALDENTRALKENTEMMRALLQSGYKLTGSLAAQQTLDQRYRSSVAVAEKPALRTPVFSDVAPETIIPMILPETVVKQQPLLASVSPLPVSHKPITPIMEPAKNIRTNASTATPVVVAAAPAKVEKQQIDHTSVASKRTSVPSGHSKVVAGPHMCFLHRSLNSSEKEAIPYGPAKSSAATRTLAANTSIKPKTLQAKSASPKVEVVKAIVVPAKPAAIHKVLAANTNTKSQLPKRITQVTGSKMPMFGTMNSNPRPGRQYANTLPAFTVARPQAKTIAPATEPKMPLASAVTKTPNHLNLPANPLSATIAAKPEVKTVAKPQVSLIAAPKTAPVNAVVKVQAPAKMTTNAKIPAVNTPVKPQATISSPMHVKTPPADMEAIVITAPRRRAARATENRSLTGRMAKSRGSSISVAVASGMVTKKNKRVSLGYILQFPLLERSYDNQLRTTNHVPTDAYSGFKEGDMITTHGYISLIAIEDSGTKNETYYIQLVANPYRKDSCLNIRITADQFAGDARKKLTENARLFVREQLLSGKTPTRSGNVMQRPVFVSITGQLVYNSALAGAMRGPRPLYIGKKGVRSYIPWEITNVNRIQFTR